MKKFILLAELGFLVLCAGLCDMLSNLPRVTEHWDPAWLVPVVVYSVCVTVTGLILRRLNTPPDFVSAGAVFLLTAAGLLIQARMQSEVYSFRDPSPWYPLLIGTVLFNTALLVPLNKLRLSGYPAWLVATALLLIMLFFGRRYRGGIYLAGNLNPTEFVKPLLALFLASSFAFPPEKRNLPLLFVFWSIPCVLVLLLKDFGLVAILNFTFILMLLANRHFKTAGCLLLAACAVPLLLPILPPHVAVRFEIWQNPFADPLGKGWQTLQAMSALYSGGIWGTGLGSGSPQTIPIVVSDFVYAAIAEENGAVGSLLLMLVYAALSFRFFRLAGKARSPFTENLVLACTALFMTQTLLNIGGVINALPMTGITLPLISHGGSSFAATLLLLGLCVSATRE